MQISSNFELLEKIIEYKRKLNGSIQGDYENSDDWKESQLIECKAMIDDYLQNGPDANGFICISDDGNEGSKILYDIITGKSMSYNCFADLCKWLCEDCEKLSKELLDEFNLDMETFRGYDRWPLVWACMFDSYTIVEYLCDNMNLTVDEFRVKDNWALRWACIYSNCRIVEYLHRKFNLSADDFKACDNEGLIGACCKGHLDVVKYLHEKVGLIANDFRINNNDALIAACEKGRFDVVKYLCEKVGLKHYDIKSNNGRALRMAIKKDYHDIMDYLYTNYYKQ